MLVSIIVIHHSCIKTYTHTSGDRRINSIEMTTPYRSGFWLSFNRYIFVCIKIQTIS